MRSRSRIAGLLFLVAPVAACSTRADATVRQAEPTPQLVIAEAQAPAVPDPEEPRTTKRPVVAGATLDESQLPGLVSRLEPAVVNIVATHLEHGPDLSSIEELLGRQEGPTLAHRERAVGSGFILSPDGLVMTNAHVIEDADDIKVELSDEREISAVVVGRDAKLDVALLRLQGVRDLPTASLGSSEALRVGDKVVAIGNPFGLGQSVTTGIVSGKGRSVGTGPYDALLQTDASINPGNSGGPLFNAKGEVVGINTAIVAHGKGVSFAIPIDDVRPILRELQTTGRVARGRLGIMFQTISPTLVRAMRLSNGSGALITAVEPKSPAEAAGVEPGDVVTRIDAAPVPHASELARELGRRKPGQEVKIELLRRGKLATVGVKLDRLDDDYKADTRPEHPPTPRDLGVRAIDVPDGARVEQVTPESPAADELKPGDVVMEMNGARVRSAGELSGRLADLARPGTAFFRVHRGERWLYVAIDVH